MRMRFPPHTNPNQANNNFVPTNQFEIGVSTGDLLGIIQQKDPMGDRSRWFCDNGVSQGFVPASLLAPLGASGDSSQHASDPPVARVDSPTSVPHPIEVVEEKGSKPVAVVAPYDEVAEEESKRPIRRAPGVPGLPRPRRKESEAGSSSSCARADQGSVHSYEEIAASEIASETQSQDLSPIYEEIPGGSR